jgi:hypothetical protein
MRRKPVPAKNSKHDPSRIQCNWKRDLIPFAEVAHRLGGFSDIDAYRVQSVWLVVLGEMYDPRALFIARWAPRGEKVQPNGCAR